MAELLIRSVDKVNAESAYADASCSKRGDVIAICDDGWKWGPGELHSGEHVIVKLPGVPIEKVSAYLLPEVDKDVLTKSKTLQFRVSRFDLDAYEKDVAVPLKDTKGAPVLTKDGKPVLEYQPITEKVALDLLVTKAPIADPDVIG